MENPRLFRIKITKPPAPPPVEPLADVPIGFPPWMKSFFIHRNNQYQPSLLGHITLATVAGTIALGGYLLCTGIIGYQLKTNWLEFAPQPITITEYTAITKNTAITKDICSRSFLQENKFIHLRLQSQLTDIDERIKIHHDLIVVFYKHYYANLALASVTGLTASLCLFFISKLGWDRINNAIINIFISTSGITLFCANLDSGFQYQNNLQGNQDLFLSYINLRNEIASYCSTIHSNPPNSPAFPTPQLDSQDPRRRTPEQYIFYIDSQMRQLNQIRLWFDETRLSDMEDTLKKLLMEKQVTPPVPSPSTSPSKSSKAP